MCDKKTVKTEISVNAELRILSLRKKLDLICELSVSKKQRTRHFENKFYTQFIFFVHELNPPNLA